MEDKTCKHCGKTVVDTFCSRCGQRYLKTPYSSEIISFLISQTIDFGANYFKTLWTLLIKPYKVTSTFLSGDVKTYLNPLKYLVLTVAFLIIIDLSESFITGDPDGISDKMEFYLYVALFLFSLYLIIANKICWQKYKWTEHLIISLYLAIQLFLIVIISYLPISLFEDWGFLESKGNLMGLPFIIMGMYYFYYNISVFHKPRFLSFIKSLLILVVGFILMVFSYYFLNPSEFQ